MAARLGAGAADSVAVHLDAGKPGFTEQAAIDG